MLNASSTRCLERSFRYALKPMRTSSDTQGLTVSYRRATVLINMIKHNRIIVDNDNNNNNVNIYININICSIIRCGYLLSSYVDDRLQSVDPNGL